MLAGSEPAPTIIEISQSRSVDMIMMATHGRGGFDRLIMGSVSERGHGGEPVSGFSVAHQRPPLEISIPPKKIEIVMVRFWA